MGNVRLQSLRSIAGCLGLIGSLSVLLLAANASAASCYSSGADNSLECPNMKPGPWLVDACDNAFAAANHEAQWCAAFGGTGGTNCNVVEDFTFANVASVSNAFANLFTGCPAQPAGDTGWGATVSSDFCWSGGTQIANNVPEREYRELTYSTSCQQPLIDVIALANRDASCLGNVGDGKHCARMPDNSCKVADPVQLWNLQYFATETDIPAIGGGLLEYTRHYRSQGHFYPAEAPPLGYEPRAGHWEDNFDVHLYALDPNVYPVPYLISDPDGHVHYFTSSGLEWVHYAGLTAEQLQIVRDGGGHVVSYVRVMQDDKRQTFAPDGRLIGVSDKHGHVLTLQYDASNYLASVMDERGRTLTFTRGIDGLITGIADPSGNTVGYSYDALQNLKTVAYTGSGVRVYRYADPNWPQGLTGIQDENGANFVSVEYYAGAPYVKEVRNAPDLAGGTIEHTSLTFTDWTVSALEPLAQNGGTPVTYTFAVTEQNVVNMGSVSQPCTGGCGGQTIQRRTYDSAGYPQTATDFNGRVTSYGYDDARGLETQRVEATGTSAQRTTNTTWNVNFRVPDQRTVVNVNGVTEAMTTWAYNSRGQATARCQMDLTVSGATSYACGSATNAPSGVRQWKYAYCDVVGTGCPSVGLLKSTDGPRTDVADTTTYAYYASTDLSGCATLGGTCHNVGDLQSVTNALGRATTTLSYDKNGRVTRVKDFNSVITDMTYHPRGWLLTRTVRANANGTASALDATTTFTYDNVGNVVRVTQPDGAYLHYVYDAAHRLTDIYDSATPSNYLQGNHIQYALDAAGNRIDEKTTDPSGTLKRELSRSYDRLNRLTALLNSSNVAVQTYTNPADAPPSGITYTDGYDGNGNAIYSIDGTGAHVGTEQQYDPLNRLIKTLQDHAGTGATRDTTTQYAYDTRDNLRSVIDPDGLVTSYTYDGLNNLTDLNSPDTGHTVYAYNSAGNRTKQVDARGIASTYSYDALNRLSGIAYPTASLNITYAYDQPATGCYNVGRLTKITDSSGSTTYCYDQRGNVLKKAQVTGTTTLTTFYTYSLADRLASVTYPSRLAVAYTRDGVGRIASMAYSTSAGVTSPLITSLRYLPFGPLTGITFKNGRTLTKSYDTDYAIDKVVSSAATGLIVDATVDVLGNLTSASKTVGATPPTQQYLYDPLYRLINIENGTGTSLLAFTYDLTGDRLSKTPQGQSKQAYTYTPGTHRLASVANTARQYDANGNTTGIGTTKATYDDRNRRITAGTTIYNYNGRGERVAKGTTRFVYAESGQLLGEYTSTGAAQKEYLWLDGIPVAMMASGTLYHIETDQLGAPRQVIKPATTTASDATVWKWDYFANNAAFGENTPVVQTITFNLRFPGQYYDSETGLSYNYFRDYEPGTGRYVESDPIGLAGGPSTFAYVSSHPQVAVDRSGLKFDDVVRVLTQVRLSFPDLDPRGGIMCGDLSGYKNDVVTGRTTSWITGDLFVPDGTIIVSDLFCKLPCLDRQQWEDLFSTIFHEAMHSTDPWWMTAFSTEAHHDTIRQRVTFELRRVPRFPKPLVPTWGTPLPPPGADIDKLYQDYRNGAGCCGH